VASRAVSVPDLVGKNKLTAAGQLVLSGQIAETLSTGTRLDDWAPSGIDAASGIVFDCSVATAITGVVGGALGRTLYLVNRQSSIAAVTLTARDTNSTDGNRFGTDVDVVLAPGDGALFAWSSALSGVGYWRCIGVYQGPEDTLVTEGAITIADGRAGAGVALVVGQQARGFVVGDWAVTGGRIVTSASGTFRIRLYKVSGSGYDNSTWTELTSALSPISVVSGLNATFTTSGWGNTSLSDGDVLRADVYGNSGIADWYAVYLAGTRTVTRA
jgi:hypothetical protein